MSESCRSVRVGFVSDIHVSHVEGDTERWHGELDLVGADARLASAIELFRDLGVDVVVACGDLTHHGDEPCLRHAIELLERSPGPVYVVPGNHDIEIAGGALAAVLAARPQSSVRLASVGGDLIAPGLRVAGRDEAEADGAWATAPVDVAAWGDDLVIWAAHFPVASLRDECDRARLLYAGDARDVTAATAQLTGRSAPTIALTGHLHVRHSGTAGPLLHLGAAALVEAPGDVAVVEITLHPQIVVRRRVWPTDIRPGQRMPVFAPIDETFALAPAGTWARMPAEVRRTPLVAAPTGLGILAFDWNGTLVDDHDAAWRATSRVLARRGLEPCARDAFSDVFRLPLPVFFADLGVDDPERAADEWNDHMGRSVTELMPGARSMLEQLRRRGIAVGIVSAAAEAVVKSQVSRFGLAGQLDFVEAGAPTKWRALSALGRLAHGRVAYLGDTEYDIEEAWSAGIRAWGFAGGYRPPEALLGAGAERLVEALSDLGDLVDAADVLPRR